MIAPEGEYYTQSNETSKNTMEKLDNEPAI